MKREILEKGFCYALDTDEVCDIIDEVSDNEKKQIIISYNDWNYDKYRMRVMNIKDFAKYVYCKYGRSYTLKDCINNFVNNSNIFDLFDKYPELEVIGVWVTLDKVSYDKMIGLCLEF